MPGRRISLRSAHRAVRRRLSAVAAAIFLAVGCLPVQVCALPAGYFRNHPNESGKIALTFDDGPHPRYTEEILDILAEYNIRATFFLIGENVTAHPEIAEKLSAAGHEVGNHTYSHPSLNGLSADALKREIEACEEAIGNALALSPKLFRPPQGVLTDELEALVRQKDYSVILWDVDTMDWAGTSAEEICANVMSHTKSGDIILMHDFHGKRCSTATALRRILPALLSRDFTFVTVSELLESE